MAFNARDVSRQEADLTLWLEHPSSATMAVIMSAPRPPSMGSGMASGSADTCSTVLHDKRTLARALAWVSAWFTTLPVVSWGNWPPSKAKSVRGPRLLYRSTPSGAVLLRPNESCALVCWFFWLRSFPLGRPSRHSPAPLSQAAHASEGP